MSFVRLFGIAAFVVLTIAGTASSEGLLRYAGATTLQRYFMPEMANLFSSDTAIKIQIEGGNTGPGLTALLNDEIDMAGAGRLLIDAEKKQGLVEHLLGWDVLAIVVHKQNPVETLTLDQLQGIFSGELTDWQDVGGAAGPILVVTSPSGSGMHSAVKSQVLRGKEYLVRQVISAVVAESDQQVSMFVTGITALSKSMIDSDDVKTVKVDGVAPTVENVSDGSYPLTKPLTLVTRGKPQGDLARFMDLVASPQGKAVFLKSFVPASSAQ